MTWTHKYLEAVRDLDLDPAGDKKATQLLHMMLEEKSVEPLRKLISGRAVIIFGCGPSLENDLNKLYSMGLQRRAVNVAVDGAVKALLQYKIVPHVNVTDLDGDANSIIKANRYGCITLVHAHSANMQRIAHVVPMLKGKVYGTTHSEETSRVRNFGGFTDGDRAMIIVDSFKPRFVVLAGMDFGHAIGVYSGSYDSVSKPRRLRVGKAILEDMLSHTHTKVFNVTSSGEHIKNTHHLPLDKLSQLL